VSTDKLIIDTPEQVHLEFVLAGIGSRFMAAFLDALIQLAVYLLLFVVYAIARIEAFGSYPLWIEALVILAVFCMYWGYYAIFEIFWKGQTPGKRWAGIRVIKDSGRPINVFEAIGRNLIRFIDFLPILYGVGVLTMMLNQKNRRLGDFVAGTLVVHETVDRSAKVFFNTQQTSDFAIHQAAHLTLQEVELVETFLARRLEIPPEVRAQTAQRIAGMLATRLNISPEARPADNENFLELVVREFRNRAKYR